MPTEKFPYAVLRSLIGVIPFSWVKAIGSRRLITVYYHVVNNEDAAHVRHLYEYKNANQFSEDMEFLLSQYSPIAMSEVLQLTRDGRDIPPNRFLLTFDDGFREIHDVVAPILLDKGIPATFFISSAFLDNRDLCYLNKASLLVENSRNGVSRGTEEKINEILAEVGLACSCLAEGLLKIDYRGRGALDRIAAVMSVDFQKYLEDKQPYLTTAQVRKLIDSGFAIGSHSVDHPYYSTLSLDEQLQQTLVSTREIREEFALDYGVFAFPHNDAGVCQEFYKRIHESGLIDMTFGTGGMLSRGIEGHRQRVSLEKPVLPAKEILAWQYARKLYHDLTD